MEQTQDTPQPDATSLSIPPTPVPVQVQPQLQQILPYSMARPVWYVVLMSVATFGFYYVVWFARSWRTLLAHYGLRGNAVVNAIFSPLCAVSLFRYAFQFGAQGGYQSSMDASTAASLYILFTIIGRFFDRMASRTETYGIADVLGLVFFLSLIPVIQGVRAMNAGYAATEPDRRMRTTLSAWSIVFLILGSLCWLLVFVGILMPE